MMDAEQVQNRSKVTPKRFKITDGEEEEEDRISLLPDCLILDILSRLPDTKQAIKTGTLSKRWQHLWCYVPNLIFHRFGNDNRPLNEFCSLVDKTLTQCRQLYLNKFQLYTQYDIQFQSQFTNWIHYAISCNVQEFDMILASPVLNGFVLDQLFFTTSSFTHLILGGCVFNPTGAISWNKLTSLSIQFAKIDGELIENILSGSPSLETLKLEHCYGYRRLDINSKSVKNLVLSGYDNREDVFQYMTDIVEINAPNILSLTIEDEFYLSKLLLLDVSSLVKAFLDYSKDGLYYPTPEEAKEEMLKGFIQKLCQVKELTIGFNCVGTLSCLEAKGFNLPTNLKILDGDSEMIFEPSDSESSESGDLDEPLLDDFEVDESFDSDSDESGDSEEQLLDDDSEADE